jgi:hypothetical protein
MGIHRIEKYFIMINGAFGQKESQNFTDKEIDLVKSCRQNIEIKTNQTTKEKYPVFICLPCKSFFSRNRRRRF